MIQGFERPEQVRDVLIALRAERRASAHDKAKVAVIDKQIASFTVESERMRAEADERLARETERAQAEADLAAGVLS